MTLPHTPSPNGAQPASARSGNTATANAGRSTEWRFRIASTACICMPRDLVAPRWGLTDVLWWDVTQGCAECQGGALTLGSTLGFRMTPLWGYAGVPATSVASVMPSLRRHVCGTQADPDHHRQPERELGGSTAHHAAPTRRNSIVPYTRRSNRPPSPRARLAGIDRPRVRPNGGMGIPSASRAIE